MRFLSYFRIPFVDHAQNGKHIFWLGLAIYAVLQVFFHISIMEFRTTPYGPDDAYTYILKAPQITDGCFFQDCAALTTLREQFREKQTKPELAWTQYRVSTRTFLVYHPLHSLVLAGLHETGLTWEQAYNGLLVAGVCLVGIAVAFFLRALCGNLAAGIALALLSVTLFRGQGLHLLVPSNLSLAVGLIAWAVALQCRERAVWYVVMLLPIMLTLHPVGRIYGVLSLAFCFMASPPRLHLRQLLPYAIGAAFIAAATVAPMVIDQPQVRYTLSPTSDVSFISGFMENIQSAGLIITSWDSRAWSLKGLNLKAPLTIFIFATAVLGFYRFESSQRRRVLIVFSVISTLCLASLFMIMPSYPAEFFSRVWVVLAAIILGAAAHGILSVIAYVRSPDRTGRPKRIAAGISVMLCLFIYLASGGLNFANWIQFFREHENLAFAETQPRTLATQCGTAVYTAEVPLLYFLSHGALNCPSIYLPTLSSQDVASRLAGLPAPWFIVAPKPAEEQLQISGPGRVTITVAATTPSVGLRFSNKGPETEVVLKGRMGTQTVKIPAGNSGWLNLDAPPLQGGERLEITAPTASRRVMLTGLRTSEQQRWSWPWGSDIHLLHHLYANYEFEFELSTLMGGAYPGAEIIAEDGGTVLARLKSTPH